MRNRFRVNLVKIKGVTLLIQQFFLYFEVCIQVLKTNKTLINNIVNKK